MVFYRSVPHRILKTTMSTQDFDALMRTKKEKDEALEAEVKKIVSRWKAKEITAAEKDALEAPIYAAYEAWALSAGIYESPTEAQLDEEDRNAISEVIEARPTASILKIVTRIANFYRAKEAEAELTENQLMSLAGSDGIIDNPEAKSELTEDPLTSRTGPDGIIDISAAEVGPELTEAQVRARILA